MKKIEGFTNALKELLIENLYEIFAISLWNPLLFLE